MATCSVFPVLHGTLGLHIIIVLPIANDIQEIGTDLTEQVYRIPVYYNYLHVFMFHLNIIMLSSLFSDINTLQLQISLEVDM